MSGSSDNAFAGGSRPAEGQAIVFKLTPPDVDMSSVDRYHADLGLDPVLGSPAPSPDASGPTSPVTPLLNPAEEHILPLKEVPEDYLPKFDGYMRTPNPADPAVFTPVYHHSNSARIHATATYWARMYIQQPLPDADGRPVLCPYAMEIDTGSTTTWVMVEEPLLITRITPAIPPSASAEANPTTPADAETGAVPATGTLPASAPATGGIPATESAVLNEDSGGPASRDPPLHSRTSAGKATGAVTPAANISDTAGASAPSPGAPSVKGDTSHPEEAHLSMMPVEWKRKVNHRGGVSGHGYTLADDAVSKAATSVEYADGSRAIVIFPRVGGSTDPKDPPLLLPTFLESWQWDTAGVRHVPVELEYAFGLALAVNSRLWLDEPDGILGLGISSYQKGIRGTYRSFLDELARMHPKGPQMGEPEGATMYFGLRPRRHTYDDIDSFLAINGWPCEKMPIFSNPIPVVIQSLAPKELWTVTLLGMEFKRYMTIPPATHATLHDVGSVTELASSPLHVVLDTGCSVSHVPSFIVTAIARTYAVEPNLDDNNTPPYVIPRDGCHRKDVVVMRFAGVGPEIIEIVTPAEHFLWTKVTNTSNMRGNVPNEGLVYSHTQRYGQDGAFGVLGLNWFHANWVSMVKPRSGTPFVRLAAQEHFRGGGTDDYKLPSAAQRAAGVAEMP